MLTITDRAAAALVKNLARHGMPETQGHRIFRLPEDNAASRQFRLQTASSPAVQDVVVACGQTHVFIAPDVVEALADAVLDVRERPEGPALVLRPSA